MIIWCDKDYLKITSDIEPITTVRKPLPGDSKKQRKTKSKKPYINIFDVTFTINYLGTIYEITIKSKYIWDGSSCVGLHHYPPLLNASMIHDIICENHELVGNDRQLSSMIFREMGISSHVNKLFMYCAYFVIDLFQKYFGKDDKKNNWK